MDFVEFALTPFSRITPFGEEGAYSLHWFGLSDGRYRLRFGPHLLLDYSADALAAPAPQPAQHSTTPCNTAPASSWVDYYVTRLWEDMLLMLPNVLQPVPPELEELSQMPLETWTRCYDFATDAPDEPDIMPLFDGFASWRDSHFLDTGYLRPSAGISFWNQNGEIVIRWDNRDKTLDGVAAWSSQSGEYRLSYRAFVSGVQSFHEQFMQAMAARIEGVCAGWTRPEIAIDLEQIRQEHLTRQAQLARALARAPDEADLEHVRDCYASFRAVMQAATEGPSVVEPVDDPS